MSGVAIIKHLLDDYGPLTSMVPASRIKAGVLPQGVSLPAIGIMKISGVDRNVLGPGTRVHVRQRIQVSVKAENYVQQKELINLVRLACRDTFGTVGTYLKVAVLTAGEGPDDSDAQAQFFVESQDFMVSFSQLIS